MYSMIKDIAITFCTAMTLAQLKLPTKMICQETVMEFQGFNHSASVAIGKCLGLHRLFSIYFIGSGKGCG